MVWNKIFITVHLVTSLTLTIFLQDKLSWYFVLFLKFKDWLNDCVLCSREKPFPWDYHIWSSEVVNSYFSNSKYWSTFATWQFINKQIKQKLLATVVSLRWKFLLLNSYWFDLSENSVGKLKLKLNDRLSQNKRITWRKGHPRRVSSAHEGDDRRRKGIKIE